MIKKNGWKWIPTLYFAEGLPYVIVMSLSVIFYKRLELSNTDIALYTSWLYLPWVIKPIWSPIVDIIGTKRNWVVLMQFIIGAGLAGIALTIPTDNFVQYTMAFFWLVAFSSATHDIAADGFYMIGLDEHQQSFFVGIRSTFYRIAMITGQGLLVVLAGYFEVLTDNIKYAWSITFFVTAIIFLLLAIYHKLSFPKVEQVSESKKELFKEFFNSFRTFFIKKDIGLILLFILFYRFGEAQLVKLASPFMLDSVEKGGLALSTSEVGIIYGTIGVIALVAGGILGGVLVSKGGLKKWLLPMVFALNAPDILYVLLSLFKIQNLVLISSAVAFEQFGYGFGFTAFMMYLIYISDGDYKTSHYAIATGIMALGMMLPGMVSGWIQDHIGYTLFFIWVCIATIPSFLISLKLKIDPQFGIKSEEE